MPKTKFVTYRIRKKAIVREVSPVGNKLYITTSVCKPKQFTKKIPKKYKYRAYVQRGNKIKVTYDEIKKPKLKGVM